MSKSNSKPRIYVRLQREIDEFSGPARTVLERMRAFIAEAEASGLENPEISIDKDYSYDYCSVRLEISGMRPETPEEAQKRLDTEARERERAKARKKERDEAEFKTYLRLQKKYGAKVAKDHQDRS